MRNSVLSRRPGIVLWSRVRLCRNLAGYPFVRSGKAKSCPSGEKTGPPSVKTRRAVYEKIQGALNELNPVRRMTLKPVTEIPDWKIIEYYERGLFSSHLKNHRDDEFRGIITASGASVVAMVNERHHLVLQDLRPGYQLERAWSEVDKLDDLFSSKLKFAWSRPFGYLGPDSECCGTGLDVMFNVHLPGLILLDEMSQVGAAFGAVGLRMDSEISDDILVGGFGQLLRISNNMAVPDSEETVLDKMDQAVGDLVVQEHQARLRLLKEPSVKRDLYNKIACSLAVLKNALIMTRPDLFEYSS